MQKFLLFMELKISVLRPRSLTSEPWSEPDKSNPNSQTVKSILNFRFRGILFLVYLTMLLVTENI
jgi:hypothetical protein